MMIVAVVRVTMIVAAMLVIAVIMMAVIMMTVTMRHVAATGIGPAFRIERRLDGNDARTEAPHHVLDNVIAPDAKSLANNLGGQMAIAKMPGDAHQMKRIGAADLHQRLGGRDHLDQPAVFQHQGIAAPQRNGFL